MSYDAEKASVAAAFSEESVRRGFIKKVAIFHKKVLQSLFSSFCLQVYSIISVQLLVTFGTVALFNQSAGVQGLFFKDYGKYDQEPNIAFWAVFAVSAIAGFVIILAMACVKTLRVSVPINFILLAVFTIAESLLVGLACMLYEGEVVLIAAAATAGIVIALTAFSFQTRIDFTILRGLMVCVLFVFILFGLLISIFAATGGNIRIVNLVYAAIGVLIFSVYLVIDTQVIKELKDMMKAHHKFLSDDDMAEKI